MSTHFAFDLDGTVTTAEMLPIIASALDLQNEMRLLTELTLNGTIGFEESFRLRCAILRSIPIDTVQEIVAEVPMDEHIAGFIRANPDRCAIVTGNLDVWIKPLVDRLGCRAFSSKARVHDNRLEAVTDILRKNHPIQQMRPYAQRIVAVGDSFNDIPMFEMADLGVAFGGVHQPMRGLIDIADYVVLEGAALCRLLNTL